MTIPSNTPVRTRTKGRKQFLHYVFTTALEDGISYWAEVDTYYWMNPDRKPESRITDDDYMDLDGFYASIIRTEGGWGVDKAYQTVRGPDLVNIEDNEILRIDLDVMERGANLMVEKIMAAAKSEDPSAPFSRKYLRQFVIQWLTDGSKGYSDAEVADMVVQLGLFGEVVYG